MWAQTLHGQQNAKKCDVPCLPLNNNTIRAKTFLSISSRPLARRALPNFSPPENGGRSCTFISLTHSVSSLFSHSLSLSLLSQSNDDKEKANSPFESNGIKKDDQVNATNGVAVNGIDDDKGFK